jgi:hypothetical protein
MWVGIEKIKVFNKEEMKEFDRWILHIGENDTNVSFAFTMTETNMQYLSALLKDEGF